MLLVLKNVLSLIPKTQENLIKTQQIRHKFTDWRMYKDYKKRKMIEKHGKERLRINSIRKNNIIPIELKALADEELANLPRQSSIVQLENRCAVTSRARGTVNFFRVSRIVFRHLADYNKLSGVQRALW